ncbi:MAG: peptide deformylase [Cyanobacteria bacterium]|nr:peptide deformylase [Cyanobacteriota bacterium]MDW8199980.1 peptide deformylase [Cyanobacteriota bacterium SKYGB_h_bin112]
MAVDVLVEKKKLAKPPLKVHQLGDRVLRQTAKRVSKVDDELRTLVREMLQTMYSQNGIGLAAPQIAIQKQLLVIDCQPDEATTPPLVMINPVINQVSDDLAVDQEGCLSIPGVFLDVRRPEIIDVSFKDEHGRPQRMMASGLLARVIQHEMDHLNGVLFVDRVENELALNQELSKHGFSQQAVRPIR